MGFAQAAASSASDRIVSINPATGVPLGDVPDMTADQVRAAVDRAHAAQREWGKVDLRERCRRVRRFSVELMRRADEVIGLITAEGGKTPTEALGTEVAVVADLTNYFCKHAPKMLGRETINLHLLKHRRSYIHYVPRGVVGIIAPWNFPFSIPIGEVIMAAIAGNGVVLKPSEITPLIGLKAKELWDAAGLPPELFQVVTGRGQTGAALIDAGIQYCVFTGSVATGRKVAAACGERLIPCTMELGGKAPAVVCADADLERTANAITWGGFCNSGQICCSVERVYAHESVHDELVDRIVKNVEKLRQGDASSNEVDVGAMTWDKQADNVERLVDAAVKDGARIRTGGTRPSGPGIFYPPTVLTDCRQEMAIMRDEIFGPALPIMKVGSEAEAVELANDSDLGLLAYVFTKDKEKGQRLATQIEAGTVMVNDVLNTYGCPETPWGGVKMSGFGRTHSIIGLRDLCEIRHVNVDRWAPKKELWYYPYSSKTYRMMLKAMKLILGNKRFSL
jgi:succinate-semialdehyde dehydrogenase/glutarate-semialdehyde dehydrogenase